MKKYTLFIIIATFYVAFAQTMSAQNIAFYFELIPDAQLPHLKPDMRKGMVGMYELGQRPASVPNLLNGVCTLDTLSNDFLSMHTSKVSTLSIKMLPIERDTTSVLAVIHTVKAAGTLDSGISFFTNTWSKLPIKQFLTIPTVKDFYVTNEEISLDDFSKLCSPLLISYAIDGNQLTATIDPEKYLSVEAYKKISPAIRPSLRYSWRPDLGTFSQMK